MSESTPPVATDIIAPAPAAPPPDPNSFGPRLEAARLNAGLSKAATCRLLDISAGSYANYLKAVTTPHPDRQARMLKKLAEYQPPVVTAADPQPLRFEYDAPMPPVTSTSQAKPDDATYSSENKLLEDDEHRELAKLKTKAVPELNEALASMAPEDEVKIDEMYPPIAPAPPPPIKPVLGPGARRLVRFRP